jgi:hypothetical protein
VKQLGLLIIAVVVLLGAWLVFISIQKNPESPFATLDIPKDPINKRAVVRSANQLWKATPGYYDPARTVALIKLIHGALGDDEWQVVSAPVVFACENLRKTKGAELELAGLDGMLLSRFERRPTLHEAESLVRAGNAKGPSAARINPALERLVTLPREGGYAGSALSFLVAASVACEDFGRAAKYLDTPSRDVAMPEADRAWVGHIRRSIDICISAQNKNFEIPAAIDEWRGTAQDALGRSVYRPALVNVGYLAAESLQTDPARRKAVELMEKTTAGAPEYWHEVIERVITSVLAGSTDDVPLLSALAAAYERDHKKTDYAAGAWYRVAAREELRHPDLLLWAADPLERALAAAHSPNLVGDIARLLSKVYLASKEFTKARQAVERALGRLPADSAAVKELSTLLIDLKTKEADDLARVAKEKKEIERRRLTGQLDHMKQQLETARKQKRSEQDIRSIESTIKEISRRVDE